MHATESFAWPQIVSWWVVKSVEHLPLETKVPPLRLGGDVPNLTPSSSIHQHAVQKYYSSIAISVASSSSLGSFFASSLAFLRLPIINVT